MSKFEKLEFKAGIVEGVYYDANTIVKIAKIPSREVLLSKLLGSFKSPMASFARVINEVLKSKGRRERRRQATRSNLRVVCIHYTLSGG